MNFVLTVVIGLCLTAIIVSLLLLFDGAITKFKNPEHYRFFDRLLGFALMMLIIPMAYGAGDFFLWLIGE
jgi:threonine/homoserine/homoserine lactone efflux protein